MTRNRDISNELAIRRQWGAWVFLALMSMTIIPFNLFHNHSDEIDHDLVSTWTTADNDLLLERNGQCDHEIHVGQEQQLCFLCHFAFAPGAPHYLPNLSGDLETNDLPALVDDYGWLFSTLSIQSILNKGSPLA